MAPAASSTGNNNSNNAAVQAAKAEREERLRTALRAHILKDRQRKKEEYEAKVEEERLRKEREARERENDMTLEDTRSQIAKLDEQLENLRNQKQQLFLQLKKVLNEDETRKKQQKDNEMFALQALQAQQASVAAPPPQVFLPSVRHHQMPILPKPIANQPIKRGRTPSPPSHPTFYKAACYPQTKHDDGRRGADYARVLWNKPSTQYSGPGTLFYQTSAGNAPPPQAPDARSAMIYPYNLPLRPAYHLELQPATSTVPTAKSDGTSKPTQVYHINLDQPMSQTGAPPPPGSQSNNTGKGPKPQVTMEKISNDRFHNIEVKHESVPTGHGPPPPHGLNESVVYTPLLPGMSLHPMQIGSNSAQNNKSGGGLSQSYAQGQQLSRQQQLSVLPPPPQGGQQTQQQQIHFPRHYM